MDEDRALAGRPAAARSRPGLYLVATPIGNARDITLRALDVLAAADLLAAEDTRTTRRLLAIHGVRRPPGGRLVPYHDHNGPAQRPRLLGGARRGPVGGAGLRRRHAARRRPRLPAGGRGDRRRPRGDRGARAPRRRSRRSRSPGCRPTASCSPASCRRAPRPGAGRSPSSRRCRRRWSSTRARAGSPRASPTWPRCSGRTGRRRSAASSPSASRRPGAAPLGALAERSCAARRSRRARSSCWSARRWRSRRARDALDAALRRGARRAVGARRGRRGRGGARPAAAAGLRAGPRARPGRRRRR